jgi:hypothetical protein
MSKTTPKTLWKHREDTVFSTWEVSVESLDTICRDAVLTLDVCAFLDNGNIQEEMFVNCVDYLKHEFGFGILQSTKRNSVFLLTSYSRL